MRQRFRASHSPASHHRAIASVNFLKTHAIKIVVIRPSPRAPSKKFLIKQPNGFRWEDCWQAANSAVAPESCGINRFASFKVYIAFDSHVATALETEGKWANDMATNLDEALFGLTEQQTEIARAEEHFRRLVPKPGGVAINPRPLDLVMLGAVHRTRHLLEAVRMLCDARNTIALDPLVRMQLDTLLRINAVLHEKEPYDVEVALISGEKVRNLKTVAGNKMYDKELLDLLNSDLPWVREIYEKYSDAIHFSTDHVQQSLRQAFFAPSDIDVNGNSQKQFIDDRLCEAISDLLKVTRPLTASAISYLQGRLSLVPEVTK